MKHARKTIFLLLALGIWTAAFAQQPVTSKPPEPDRTPLEELRDEGEVALYNLDYETARRRFGEISRLYPDHPVGPMLLASTLWMEKLTQLRRLRADLYSTQSFYTKTDEKPDARVI